MSHLRLGAGLACATLAAVALTLAGCGQQATTAPAPASTVAAQDYRAFYLWSGVRPPPAMQRAEAVYLLWGEVRRHDPSHAIALRRTPPLARAGETWLVVRAERLDWGEGAYADVLAALRRWQASNPITGVQVDFDSSTGGLGNYAAFLRGFRTRLPAGVKLSATGLMDWPAHASDADLAAMVGTLDEIVIQTYQHRTTLPDYGKYLAQTGRLHLPYRVALVEGGTWQAPPHLARDRNFRGYVVFLLPSARDQKP